MLCFHLGQSLM